MARVIGTVTALLALLAPAVAGTKVALLDFRDVTPKGSQAWLGVAAPQLLGSKLKQVAGIDVVDMNQGGRMPGTPPAEANEIAKPAAAAGAKIGIGGRVYYTKKEIRFAAVIVDAQPEFLSKYYLVIGECKAVGPPAKTVSLLSDLAVSILEKLKAKPTPAELARVRRDPTTNPAALEQAAAGTRLQRSGEYTKALASYDQALKADPRFAEMHTAAAYMLLHLGKPEEAAQRMATAVELVPDDPGARVAYALGLVAAGRPQDAIQQTGEAERLWPNNPDMALWDAYILSVRGDHEGALKKCQSVAATPGLDPGMLFLPLGTRISSSPGVGVLAGRLPVELLMATLGSEGRAATGPEQIIIPALLADQICFLITPEDGRLPDLKWIHDRARLVIDGKEVRPNLMGRLFAALGKEEGDGREDSAMLCFDASVNGTALITDDTQTLTLVIDEFVGARREFTWVRPAAAQRCLLELMAPLLAQAKRPTPQVSQLDEAIFWAVLSSLKVDAHGDAPLAALWLPPYFGSLLGTIAAAVPQDAPEATLLANVSKKLGENVVLLLLSPTLGQFRALPLEDAAASAVISVDGGAAISPQRVDIPYADQLAAGLSDDGKHTVKLIAFPALNEDGSALLGEGCRKLTLTVKGFAGASERVFTWDLPVPIPEALRTMIGGGG
jgi:hypothetical protein